MHCLIYPLYAVPPPGGISCLSGASSQVTHSPLLVMKRHTLGLRCYHTHTYSIGHKCCKILFIFVIYGYTQLEYSGGL